jgi:CubicO group peptidase (beta-lactamase class C family)
MKNILRPLVFFLAVLGASASSSTESPPQTIPELEAAIAAVLVETNTPGMIGSMVIGDELIWLGGLGMADLISQRPVGDQTLFRIGSISKSITSIAALILAERDQLALDADLEQFIPEAGLENPWQGTDPVRLYHVLEHTAGFDDIHLSEYAFSDPDIELIDAINSNTTSRISRWRPGTRMAYSNIGPAIGALAIAKAADERFEDFVQREIFDPLQMSTATYFYDPRVAASYSGKGDALRLEPYMHIGDRPSGSVGASAADMAQLLKLFIGRGSIAGQQLLSAASIDRMERATSTLAAKAGLESGYGLSNTVRQKEGFVFHGHGGSIDGFASMYSYLPEQQRGYFFSINATHREAFNKIDALLRNYLTRGLQAPEPTATLTDQDLKHFVGYYQPNSPRAELERGVSLLTGTVKISVEDGLLHSTALGGEAQIWHPVGDDRFRLTDESIASMMAVKSADGTQLLQGGPTLRKISAAHAWSRWVLVGLAMALLVSSILFALVWLPRRFRGTRLPAVAFRVWPLLASVSFAVCVGILMLAMNDPVNRLGTLSPWSVGYLLASLGFALITLYLPFALARQPSGAINPIVRWHCILVTLGNLLLLAYFSYSGMIGIRYWAY